MSKLEIEGVVLVVGGSGYLGLHLLHYLATSTKFRLAYTFNKNDAPRSHPSLQDVQGFHVDLRTGVGWDQISKTLGPVSAPVFPSIAQIRLSAMDVCRTDSSYVPAQ